MARSTPVEILSIDSRKLRAAVAAIFEAVGVPPDDAEGIAEVMVFSDLRGVESHGVQYASRYVRGLARGLINPTPQVNLVRQFGGIAVMDADNGFGFVSARKGMGKAVELAAEHGIGAVAVRNSNHFGPAAFYAMLALEHGMIGHATTDGPPHTVAWGTRHPIVCNNPIAWAFPVADGTPIVVDTALTGVKEKIRLAAQRGQTIPSDWAVGPNGRPTSDPQEALAGALLPIGQHKGSALIVANELLCGALAGARFSYEVSPAIAQGADAHDPWGAGHFLTAMKIDAFLPREEFEERALEFATTLRTAPKAEGVERIMLPGEIEAELSARRLREGIPLPTTTLDALDAVAREVGAPIPTESIDPRPPS